jgi:diguanylate cyclase (GGDEF)-like protein
MSKNTNNIEEKFKHVFTRDDFNNASQPRSLFTDRLRQSIAFARRYKFKVGIISIDLDTYKEDDPTSSNFDENLQEATAKRIVEALRETDTISSQGTDELVVILPDLEDEKNIYVVANKIINILAEPFKINHKEIYVEPYIGLSIYPDDTNDPNELITLANVSLTHGKESGEVVSYLKKK